MSSNDLLASLEENINSLLKQRDDLREEVARLTDANNRQRQEMILTHEELAVLQREHNQLQMAYSMLAQTPEREKVRRQLTRMIHMVDKAIENLKVAAADS